MTQKWRHKDFEIELDGAWFVTKIGDKIVRSSSLQSARRAIDKHLDSQAKAVVINLPVVYIKTASRSRDREEVSKVITGVITGVEHEHLNILGLDDKAREILPDTPANAELLRKLLEARTTLSAIKSIVSKRTVDTWFHSRKGDKAAYSNAVTKLQESYADAKKGRA